MAKGVRIAFSVFIRSPVKQSREVSKAASLADYLCDLKPLRDHEVPGEEVVFEVWIGGVFLIFLAYAGADVHTPYRPGIQS
jgi:hypothetical protein